MTRPRKRVATTLCGIVFSTGLATLTACSDGGDDNQDKAAWAATLTTENVKQVAVAAYEAVENGRGLWSLAPTATTSPVGVVHQDARNRIARAMLAKTRRQSTYTTTTTGDCGGVAQLEYYDDSETSAPASFAHGSIVYDGYCHRLDANGQSEVITGQVSFSASEALLTLSYQDLRVFQNGLTQVYAGAVTFNVESGEVSVDGNFTGSDARDYEFHDFSVTGDRYSGLRVSGTLVDPDHGSVVVTTPTPITYGDCANDVPNAGTLAITGADNTSGSLKFYGCSEYMVCVSGGATLCNSHSW